MSEPLDPNYTKVRVAKQAIHDEAWIKAFLKHTPVGVLATVFADQPFLSTKLFVYDQSRHCIFLHAADSGRVMQNVRLNPKVCFTAYEMGRFLPAGRARSFNVEYQSVVVFGALAIVEDPQESLAALRLVMEKYAPHLTPGEDYPPIDEKELHGLAVYRLDISGWSAKAEQALPDHPGAYRYEDLSKK